MRCFGIEEIKSCKKKFTGLLHDSTTECTTSNFWHSVLVQTGNTTVLFCHFSVCSGLVSAILGTPADVVKTRFMNQPTENGRFVRGTFQQNSFCGEFQFHCHERKADGECAGFRFCRGSLYKSSIDCLVKTVRSEGFYALYKGFIPIWARMVRSWIFECVRSFLRPEQLTYWVHSRKHKEFRFWRCCLFYSEHL